MFRVWSSKKKRKERKKKSAGAHSSNQARTVFDYVAREMAENFNPTREWKTKKKKRTKKEKKRELNITLGRGALACWMHLIYLRAEERTTPLKHIPGRPEPAPLFLALYVEEQRSFFIFSPVRPACQSAPVRKRVRRCRREPLLGCIPFFSVSSTRITSKMFRF